MALKIKIYTESTGYIKAEIMEDRNPQTAAAIIKALPLESNVDRWGDEVYFDIPVNVGEENSQREVEIGEMGFWPAGNSFCIFFGKTPASIGEKPVAASPVNVFGKVLGDPTVFRKTKNGEKIRIEKYSE